MARLRCHELRFGTIKFGEQPLESFQLGLIVEDDVRIVRMVDEIVLMVALAG